MLETDEHRLAFIHFGFFFPFLSLPALYLSHPSYTFPFFFCSSLSALIVSSLNTLKICLLSDHLLGSVSSAQIGTRE